MNITKALREIEGKEQGTRFDRLVAIVTAFWGAPRTSGSHFVWKTTWQDQPVINLQKEKGKAKSYQVRQVIVALRRYAEENDLLDEE